MCWDDKKEIEKRHANSDTKTCNRMGMLRRQEAYQEMEDTITTYITPYPANGLEWSDELAMSAALFVGDL